MKRVWLLPLIALVAACSGIADDITAPSPNAIGTVQLAQEQEMRDRYIIVFRETVQDPFALSDQLSRQFGGTLHYRYGYALKGFAATLPAAAVNGLRNNPNVAYIEQDAVMSTVTTQTNVTWGLDRIDQRDRPLSGTYTYDQTGSGVRAYIIDTGIRRSHNDFGGRASATGFDAFSDGRNGEDCNGHGTHVAGTVGGTSWGVAKGVSLVAVRVLNCRGSGTTSGVIAGVDWVRNNHVKPAVANMSLGGGASSALDDAVTNAVNAGVTFVVAAGNSSANACNYSPARAAAALTIGATTSTDARASYSNFGSCLDLFAPGSSITSAWYTSNTATNTISGTSMASPHVAGVAALYLQANPGASPNTVGNAIINGATTGRVTSAGSNSPNRLLYSLIAGGTTPPVNEAPEAGFTYNCDGLACSFTDASTDSDGTIVSRSWNFGDNTTSTQTNPTKTYASAGTRTVTLTVTDDDGATNSTSLSVTTTSGGGSGISLSAVGYKVKGVKHTDLSWTGANGASVQVFRGSSPIATTTNSSYTDNTGAKGGGSITYKVCLTSDTSTCSNSVTVSY